VFSLFQSYYNADTIQTIREGRSLTDVLDPIQTHTVYSNINPPQTPDHQTKTTTQQDQDEYVTVDDFLGPVASADTPPSNTPEYYNYNPLDPPLAPPVQPDPADDYNYVEVIKPNVEDPYTLEDNQYIYMQSRHETGPAGARPIDQFLDIRAHSGSSPAGHSDEHEVGKKYQNFERDQQKKRYVNINDFEGGTSPRHTKEKIMAELHFPPKTAPAAAVFADDKQEELYEELT